MKPNLIEMKSIITGIGATLALIANQHAALVFSDTFATDTSSDYRVLEVNPDRDGAQFAYDYGAVGIPEAPNSGGANDTRGVRLHANNPAAGTTNATSAVQLIPIGVGSTLVNRDYSVHFDIWMNVNGPLPGGGGGSTEAFMAGVGWNGRVPAQVGTENGTYFTITGEGGSSTDVRSFTNDGFNVLGINQGPSNNSSDSFYTGIFPGGVDVGALPVQGGVGNQTGVTAPGQMAFMWHEVRIDVAGPQVDFYVDDLLIASDADADRTGNIMVGYADYFSSESDAPEWSFGVIDNLRVDVIPEPSSALLSVFGIATLLLRRRR